MLQGQALGGMILEDFKVATGRFAFQTIWRRNASIRMFLVCSQGHAHTSHQTPLTSADCGGYGNLDRRMPPRRPSGRAYLFEPPLRSLAHVGAMEHGGRARAPWIYSRA